MAKYATQQMFGGQRATVCRSVLLAAQRHDGKEGVCLKAGVITAISSDGFPWINIVGALGSEKEAWTFVETRTVEDAEAMPLYSWTWPPKI